MQNKNSGKLNWSDEMNNIYWKEINENVLNYKPNENETAPTIALKLLIVKISKAYRIYGLRY